MTDARTLANLLAEAATEARVKSLQYAMVEDCVERDRWTVIAVRINSLLREVVEETARDSLCDTRWQLSWRADPVANVVAKRHYNSQSPDSAQWVKPGACLCFRTAEVDALWPVYFALVGHVEAPDSVDDEGGSGDE